jgi:hypothetical protein
MQHCGGNVPLAGLSVFNVALDHRAIVNRLRLLMDKSRGYRWEASCRINVADRMGACCVGV